MLYVPKVSASPPTSPASSKNRNWVAPSVSSEKITKNTCGSPDGRCTPPAKDTPNATRKNSTSIAMSDTSAAWCGAEPPAVIEE